MDTSRAFDLSPLAQRAAPRSDIHYATDAGRDILANDPDGWEVDAPWLWWINGGEGDGPGEFPIFGNPPPGSRTPLYGLAALPAVTRCTHLIVETLACAPWMIRRGWDRLETPDWIADPQCRRIDARVADPGRVTDVRLTNIEFFAQWILAALWLGDGYIYVPVRNDDGSPRPPIWQLHPEAVTVEDGRYWVEDIELEPQSIIHLRGVGGLYDESTRGSGVLVRHAEDIGLSASIRHYAAGTFRAGVPAGYLKVGSVGLTPNQADDLKRRWMRAHGRGRRSIAVLNATTDFVPISVTPLDAQLDKQREWGLRDIALAFNCPPYLLGVPGDSATYANVESRLVEFKTFTELPWASHIEAAVDAEFPRGTSLKIALDALLRADTKSRYEAYKLAIDLELLTVDEARALEDRPPCETARLDQIDPVLPDAPVTGGEIQ